MLLTKLRVDLDYDTLMIAESTDFRKTPVDMSYPY